MCNRTRAFRRYGFVFNRAGMSNSISAPAAETSAWTEGTLGDFVRLQRGHDLTDDDRRPGNVPVMGAAGMNGYHDTAIAKAPGVVIGRSGASFGKAHYCPQKYWPHYTALYVTDFLGNDPRFAYYFLKSYDFSAYNSGSAQPSLNRNFVYRIPVRVPPPAEQRAIAGVLGALDDKMELNRRMNETLEAIAQAQFRRMMEEGGGTETELGEHVEVTKGLSYKGPGLADDGIPLHNLNAVYEGGGYKHEGIKYYTAEYKDRHVCHPGDVIVANTEQGFDYLLIGYPAIVPRRFGKFGLFTHHIYRVRPKTGSPLTNHFVFLLLMYRDVREQVISFTNGTTVNALAAEGLQRPRFTLPPVKRLRQFEETVAPMFAKQEENIEESQTLAALRDALLPKLLSGAVRVKEVT